MAGTQLKPLEFDESAKLAMSAGRGMNNNCTILVGISFLTVVGLWLGFSSGAGQGRQFADPLGDAGVDKALAGKFELKRIEAQGGDAGYDCAGIFCSSETDARVGVGIIGVDERGGVVFKQGTRGSHELR